MWIKLFRKRKAQTVMIFFVVLLCTTLLNGAMTILTSLNEPYHQLKEECHPADLSVFLYSGLEEDANAYGERFKELDEVDEIVKIPYTYVSDEIYVADQKINAFIDLVEYNEDAYRNLRFVDGRTDIEQALSEGKCFIPACIQNEYKLKVGDVLTIQNADCDIPYEIAGVIAEPYSTSTAFDAAVLVKELPQELQKVQYKINVFAMPGYTGKEIQQAYQQKYHGIFPGFIETVDGVIDNGLIAIHIVAALFLAIGIIMLIVSGLIINFMVRHAMIADAKSIAVYKTIGYTTGTILSMYLLFYFSIVAVASILGVAASKLLAQCVLGGLFENLGQTTNINVITTGVWSILIVIAFVLLIVFSVILKTKNVKPVYALNGLTNSNTKKKKYHGGSSVAFSPMSIALRNINRDKKGVAGILITIIVTIFAVNFGIISLDVAFTQKENNDYWIGVDASDVIVNVTDTDPATYDKVEALIKENTDVDHYLSINQDERILFEWDDIDVTPSMSAFIYEDYSKVDLPVVEGRNPKNATEIAIGSCVAKAQNKEVGDYLECYLGYGTKVKLLITGIFQTYYQMGDACRLCRSAFLENDLPISYNMCSIYLKDGVDREAFIEDLGKEVGNNGEVIPRTEAFSSIMNMIVEPQKQGIPPVIVLAFIIGAINIFCIVMLKNASNEKTNGIYKSIGYATKDLVLANLYYVGIIALVSIAVAVPLIIVAYPNIMKLALGIFGFRSYPMNLNPLHLVIGNTVAFLLFIVSTLISSRSLRRINVRDLVIE